METQLNNLPTIDYDTGLAADVQYYEQEEFRQELFNQNPTNEEIDINTPNQEVRSLTPTPKTAISKQDYRVSTGMVANSVASPNSRSGGSTNTNHFVHSLKKRIGGGGISSNQSPPNIFFSNTQALNLDLQNLSSIQQKFDGAVGSGRNNSTPISPNTNRSSVQQQFKNDKIRNFIAKNIQDSAIIPGPGSLNNPKIKTIYNDTFGVVQQQLINFEQQQRVKSPYTSAAKFYEGQLLQNKNHPNNLNPSHYEQFHKRYISLRKQQRQRFSVYVNNQTSGALQLQPSIQHIEIDVTHHPSFQVTTYLSQPVETASIKSKKTIKLSQPPPQQQHIDVSIMNSSLAPDLMMLSCSSMNNQSFNITQQQFSPNPNQKRHLSQLTCQKQEPAKRFNENLKSTLRNFKATTEQPKKKIESTQNEVISIDRLNFSSTTSIQNIQTKPSSAMPTKARGQPVALNYFNMLSDSIHEQSQLQNQEFDKQKEMILAPSYSNNLQTNAQQDAPINNRTPTRHAQTSQGMRNHNIKLFTQVLSHKKNSSNQLTSHVVPKPQPQSSMVQLKQVNPQPIVVVEKKESVQRMHSPMNMNKSINSPSKKANTQSTMKDPPPIELHNPIIIPPQSGLTSYNTTAIRARKKLQYPGGSSVNLSLIRSSQQSDSTLPLPIEKPRHTQPALYLQDLYLESTQQQLRQSFNQSSPEQTSNENKLQKLRRHMNTQNAQVSVPSHIVEPKEPSSKVAEQKPIQINNQGKILKVVFVDPKEYHEHNMRSSTKEQQVADFMAYKHQKEQIMHQRSSAAKMIKRVRESQDQNSTSPVPLTILDLMLQKDNKQQPHQGILKSDLQVELNRVMKEAMSSGQRLRVSGFNTMKINQASSNILIKNKSMTNQNSQHSGDIVVGEGTETTQRNEMHKRYASGMGVISKEGLRLTQSNSMVSSASAQMNEDKQKYQASPIKEKSIDVNTIEDQEYCPQIIINMPSSFSNQQLQDKSITKTKSQILISTKKNV